MGAGLQGNLYSEWGITGRIGSQHEKAVVCSYFLIAITFHSLGDLAQWVRRLCLASLGLEKFVEQEPSLSLGEYALTNFF